MKAKPGGIVVIVGQWMSNSSGDVEDGEGSNVWIVLDGEVGVKVISLANSMALVDGRKGERFCWTSW